MVSYVVGVKTANAGTRSSFTLWKGSELTRTHLINGEQDREPARAEARNGLILLSTVRWDFATIPESLAGALSIQ